MGRVRRGCSWEHGGEGIELRLYDVMHAKVPALDVVLQVAECVAEATNCVRHRLAVHSGNSGGSCGDDVSLATQRPVFTCGS